MNEFFVGQRIVVYNDYYQNQEEFGTIVLINKENKYLYVELDSGDLHYAKFDYKGIDWELVKEDRKR